MREIKDNSNYQDKYVLSKNWPEDCFIQGGSNGFVISKNGNYMTYYIEAFPKEPKCFIRGEGDSFEEAETQAYNQYIEFSTCEKHDFIKLKNYKNGMGKCKHCGLMNTVFEPDYTCIKCGKHECYTGIKKEFKKDENSCLCKKCSSDNNNFYLLKTDYFRSKLFKGFSKCVFEECTFTNLFQHVNIDNTGLNLTKEELFDILVEDKNIYLIEYLKRLYVLDCEEYKKNYLLKEYLLDETEKTINIVQYFFDNYFKKFINIGYIN